MVLKINILEVLFVYKKCDRISFLDLQIRCMPYDLMFYFRSGTGLISKTLYESVYLQQTFANYYSFPIKDLPNSITLLSSI